MKTCLLNVIHQIGRKKCLSLKMLNTVPQIHVIKDFKNAEIVETFYEKELQKKNQIEFRVEKVIKRKGENFMPSETVMIIHLITGLMKKTYHKYIM